MEERIYWSDLVGNVRPLEVKFEGEFSVLQNQSIELGRERAKLFDYSSKGLHDVSLDEGFETREKWDDSQDQKLDNFLNWIVKKSPKVTCLEKALHGINFVARRGLLRRIAATPGCNYYVGWSFKAVKKNDVVFLYSKWEEDDAPKNGWEQRQIHRGMSFERLVMKPPQHHSSSSEDEFRAVHKLKLARAWKPPLYILSTGEIDGLGQEGQYLEAKMVPEIAETKIRFIKGLNTYLQCKLADLEGIITGDVNFKTGMLKLVAETSLEQWLARCDGTFNANIFNNCWEFLLTILEKVDSSLQVNPACEVNFTARDEYAVLKPCKYEDIFTNEFKAHFGLP